MSIIVKGHDGGVLRRFRLPQTGPSVLPTLGAGALCDPEGFTVTLLTGNLAEGTYEFTPTSGVAQISAQAGARVAADWKYVVRHVRTLHTFPGPANMTLHALMEALEEKSKYFAAVEYQLSVQDVVVNEASWASFLAAASVTKKLELKVTSVGKPFSKWKQGENPEALAQRYLGVSAWDGDRPVLDDSCFSSLEVSPKDDIEGMTLDQLLDSVVSTLTIQLSAMVDVVGSSKMSQRDFISPVLAAALLLARAKGPDGAIALRPEYHIIGKMAWGPVDYVITYRHLGIIVAEAKRFSPTQAWGQAIMQISSLRDAMLRRLVGAKSSKKRNHWEATELQQISTYAVLCTATNYRLMLYRPAIAKQSASLVTSSEIALPLDSTTSRPALKPFLHKLVLKLASLIVDEMHIIVKAIEHNPQLEAAKDLATGRLVEEEELEASLDYLRACPEPEVEHDSD